MIEKHINAISEAEKHIQQAEEALLIELAEAEKTANEAQKQADAQAEQTWRTHCLQLEQAKKDRLAQDEAQLAAAFAAQQVRLEEISGANRTKVTDFLWEEVTGRNGSSQNAAASTNR